MNRLLIKISGIVGAITIILGAFGAHALKTRLTESSLDSYRTGVLYMLFSSVVLLLLAFFNNTKESKVITNSFWLLLIGTVLFSGSIFLLTTQSITGISFSWLGPITPVGGLLMILAWVNLARY